MSTKLKPLYKASDGSEHATAAGAERRNRLARKGDGLRRGPARNIVADSPSKESAVAQRRKKVDTTEYSGRVAVRLRTIREKKGLSREQLWKILDEAGVKASVPAIFSWENGNRKIDPDMYPKLAKALGVRLFEFLPEK